MRFVGTEPFKKDYEALSPDARRRVEEALRKTAQNPRLPSLIYYF